MEQPIGQYDIIPKRVIDGYADIIAALENPETAQDTFENVHLLIDKLFE